MPALFFAAYSVDLRIADDGIAAQEIAGKRSGLVVVSLRSVNVRPMLSRCWDGATPVCDDVDPFTQNMTAEAIRGAITPRTRAIIPVHLAGWPCEMDPILELAAEHNLFAVEDCAQAHGDPLCTEIGGTVATVRSDGSDRCFKEQRDGYSIQRLSVTPPSHSRSTLSLRARSLPGAAQNYILAHEFGNGTTVFRLLPKRNKLVPIAKNPH